MSQNNKTSTDVALEYSILSLPLIAFIRWIKTLFTGEKFIGSCTTFEGITYLVLALIGIISIWHIFYRTKCPQCRSTKCGVSSIKELDRWIGQKEVKDTVKNAKGETIRTTTRYVPVTYIKEQSLYECTMCGHHWHKTKTREL